MTKEKDRLTSIWDDNHLPSFEPLSKNKLTEICVVGGGIAGISTAYQLAKRGHEVTVVDAFSLGSGQTSRTTAHLTSQLDGSLTRLVKMHGMQVIRKFHEAHSMAIDTIEHVIDAESIHCDFRRVNGFLLKGQNLNDKEFQREIESAKGCGIPCEITTKIPFFHDDVFALQFFREAQFNPGKFLKGLINVMNESDLNVSFYEGTQISHMSSTDPGINVLTTEDKYEIRAKRVVVATDAPISTKFTMHLKQHANRTYVLAFKMSEPREDILLWDTEEPYHYVRIVDDLLVVGGEDHRTGLTPSFDPFKKLEVWAREKFSFIGDVTYKWSGQVLEPNDHLPFIGKAPGNHDGIYIVTGSSGIGMTTGTIASMMLPDLIEGHSNQWESLFDPSRPIKAGMSEFILGNVSTAFQYKDWITPSEVKTMDEIPLDHGNVLREGLLKSCIYHVTSDHFEKKSAICTHLGGIVHWNDIEKTWDCPCHGSRFNVDGKAIEGPAISRLTEK